MPETLCEKYGFDHAGRLRRLALLRLDPGEAALGERLHETVIAPNVDALVDTFYDFLLDQPEARPFLSGPERITSLKRTQKAYLLSLGRDFASEAYFEDRLRIGQAHAVIGLPLALYLAAYTWFQDRIMEIICAAAPEPERNALVSFLLRITALDMTLAAETYHLEQVRDLEQSLTSMELERAALAEQVERDSLTGVHSRQAALARLEELLGRLAAGGPPFCVILADIDRFKAINDTHGHLVGDAALRQAAARIEGAVRSVDLVGRYGGEEFLLLLPGLDAAHAAAVGERVRRAVAAQPLHLPEVTLSLTVSLGVAQAVAGDTVESLVARADEALYRAKRSGRNRVECA